jgi:hypothetical protein
MGQSWLLFCYTAHYCGSSNCSGSVTGKTNLRSICFGNDLLLDFQGDLIRHSGFPFMPLFTTLKKITLEK